MARTQIPLSTFSINAETSNPAGTAGDATNHHYVNGAPMEEIVLRVVLATSGADRTVTIKAGDNPPADAAGVGDLAVVCSDNATSWIGPFSSARFAQHDDGTDPSGLYFDLSADTNVTITAFHVPRTA